MSFPSGGVWDSEDAIRSSPREVEDMAREVKYHMECVIRNIQNDGDVGDLMESVMSAEVSFGYLRLSAHEQWVRRANYRERVTE